jgi:glycosyltransferase involved in cell wall biosynthesis
MTNTAPSVSVVIPAYHAEPFIARAIQSVLDQPGIEPEIIVVVDGLLDRAADIGKDFPKTQVVVQEVNQGAPVARNRGLALAQAPYVMFLDADDWVKGPLLQGLAEALEVFHADVAFGPRIRYEPGEPTLTVSLHTGDDDQPHTIDNVELMMLFLYSSLITPCSTLWRTDFLHRQGGWNESLLKCQDFEIVHRCLIRGAKAALTAKGYGVSYQHDSEHRITLSHSTERWRSQILARSLVVEEAKARGLWNDDLKNAFTREMDRWMRSFVLWADPDIYREAEKFLDSLGGQRPPRSLAHRAGCFLLGVRKKEQLSLKVAHVKKVLRESKIL